MYENEEKKVRLVE